MSFNFVGLVDEVGRVIVGMRTLSSHSNERTFGLLAWLS
jgi:hypothetical protein